MKTAPPSGSSSPARQARSVGLPRAGNSRRVRRLALLETDRVQLVGERHGAAGADARPALGNLDREAAAWRPVGDVGLVVGDVAGRGLLLGVGLGHLVRGR